MLVFFQMHCVFGICWFVISNCNKRLVLILLRHFIPHPYSFEVSPKFLRDPRGTPWADCFVVSMSWSWSPIPTCIRNINTIVKSHLMYPYLYMFSRFYNDRLSEIWIYWHFQKKPCNATLKNKSWCRGTWNYIDFSLY